MRGIPERVLLAAYGVVSALLYGLQLAASNSARLQTEPYAPSVVRSLHSTPDGLDLAEPGAVFEITEYEDDEEEDEDDEY